MENGLRVLIHSVMCSVWSATFLFLVTRGQEVVVRSRNDGNGLYRSAARRKERPKLQADMSKGLCLSDYLYCVIFWQFN